VALRVNVESFPNCAVTWRRGVSGAAGFSYQRRLAKEQDAASVYQALAQRREGEEREILLALARAEERHAAHWAAKLDPSERRPRPPKLRARMLGWLASRLGPLVVLGLVQRTEAAGDYDRDPEATSAMAADAQAHALVVAGLAQRARARASGWFRAAVFGANDGLVSNFSLVLGMAGAGSSNQVILLSGLAGLLAGALSMAAGEYISVRSQRELLEAASRELDRPTLRALAQQEAAELGLVFRARGLPADQAERHAAALVTGHERQPADGEDAADAGVGGTDGTGTDVVGSAVGAAGLSFVTLAAVPPFGSCSDHIGHRGNRRRRGGCRGGPVRHRDDGRVAHGRPAATPGLRQLGIGAAAAVVTYGLGRVFGTTIG
jgi:vacuolar iron transporter family protein